MDVMAQIKSYMVLRGWTEYRLAKESGLAQTTVANLFKRNTLPSIPTLEAICGAFGISLSDFFNEGRRTENSLPCALWIQLSPSQRAICTELMKEFIRSNGEK